jgi:hypothetical protein
MSKLFETQEDRENQKVAGQKFANWHAKEKFKIQLHSMPPLSRHDYEFKTDDGNIAYIAEIKWRKYMYVELERQYGNTYNISLDKFDKCMASSLQHNVPLLFIIRFTDCFAFYEAKPEHRKIFKIEYWGREWRDGAAHDKEDSILIPLNYLTKFETCNDWADHIGKEMKNGQNVDEFDFLASIGIK